MLGSCQGTCDYTCASTCQTGVGMYADVEGDIVENLGEETNIYFRFVGASCILSTNSFIEVEPGSKIKVAFNFNKIHLFDKDTEKSIIYY